jgi:hypothetical protein
VLDIVAKLRCRRPLLNKIAYAPFLAKVEKLTPLMEELNKYLVVFKRINKVIEALPYVIGIIHPNQQKMS